MTSTLPKAWTKKEPGPSLARAGRRVRRSFGRRLLGLLAAAVLLLGLGALLARPALRTVGRLLVLEKNDFRRVDAVVVLPGSLPDRALGALQLMGEARADRVLLIRGQPLDSTGLLDSLGIEAPSEADINRRILEGKGIPASRILLLPGSSGSSREDGLILRSFVESKPLGSIAIVTCKYHSYRAYLNIRDALKGTGVKVYSAPSPYCTFDPDGWWRQRSQAKVAYLEIAKLAAYWMGYD